MVEARALVPAWTTPDRVEPLLPGGRTLVRLPMTSNPHRRHTHRLQWPGGNVISRNSAQHADSLELSGNCHEVSDACKADTYPGEFPCFTAVKKES